MFDQRELINYWISIEEISEFRNKCEISKDAERTKGKNTMVVVVVYDKFIHLCGLLPELSLPIEAQVFV